MKEQEPDILAAAAATLGIAIGERERKLFDIYYDELQTWNERINLVSIKSPQDIWIKHFIDSLTVIPHINAAAAKLLDIGSGAGFPGIPLKIVMKSLNVYLLEVSRKRASFLKHMCRLLQLDGIQVIHNRVEELLKDNIYLNTFDAVISRASFKLPELITLSAPFLTGGGSLIAMKGNDITDEITDSEDAAKTVGMIFCCIHDLKLPITNNKRKIVIYKKDLQ